MATETPDTSDAPAPAAAVTAAPNGGGADSGHPATPKEKAKAKEKPEKEKKPDIKEKPAVPKAAAAAATAGTPSSSKRPRAKSPATATPSSREGMRRDRKKVERLSEVIDRQYQAAVESRIVVPKGAGVKLRDCPRVLYFMYMSKPEDLKPLHNLVFNRLGKASEVRKNLLEFHGFEFDADSKEFDHLLERASGRKTKELKKSLYALDLERKQGSSQRDMAQRLCEFLLKPFDNGKKPPKKLSFQKMQEKRRGSGGSKKAPASGKKRARKDDDDQDGDGDDGEDEKVVMETDDEAGADSERMSSSSESEADSEDFGKKKKQKTPKGKKAKPQEKKKKSAAAAAAGGAKKRGRKRKASESDASDSAESEKVKAKAKPTKPKAAAAAASASSDEDDVPLKKLKTSPAKQPPTDDDIKKAVAELIAKADIDNLTVSSAIKQVCEKFLPADISDRKDFIKAAIKQAMND